MTIFRTDLGIIINTESKLIYYNGFLPFVVYYEISKLIRFDEEAIKWDITVLSGSYEEVPDIRYKGQTVYVDEYKLRDDWTEVKSLEQVFD